VENHFDDHCDKGQIAAVDHPFLQTQLVYDHSTESLPPYTQSLVDKEHSRICGDISRFKPINKIRLLDIGCGPSDFSKRLNDHIDLYFGVDPSFTELKRVKPRPRRFLARGIGEYLYLSDNYFDVVLLISVLDHCLDWKKTANRSSDLLRPGGIMIVAMENSDQLLNRYRKLMGRQVEHHGHMHFLTLNDIAAELSTNLAKLQAETFGYGFGLHSLTVKIRIPQPVLDALMPVMDAVGGLLSPRGGRVLYGCYRKNPDASVQPSSHFLVCPSCKAILNWRGCECEQCGCGMPYQDNILDAFALCQKLPV
jgi:SAM-dependent methyltransferase